MNWLQTIKRVMEPRLGYYGKLPIHPDYLKFGYGTDMETYLTRWIDKTVAHAERGDHGVDQRINRGWTIRYMIPDPKQNVVVAGLIWDSADRGGERRYPFSLYVILSNRSWKSWWEYLPAMVEWVWERLDQLRWDIQILESQDRLEEYCKNQSMGILPDCEQARSINLNALNSLTIGSYRTQLFGDESLTQWPRLWWLLKSRINRGDYCNGYAFPLVNTLGVALQVSLWSGALARTMQEHDRLPNLLVPGGSADRIFMFYRSLTPTDGHLVLSRKTTMMDNDLDLVKEKGLELCDDYQLFAAEFLNKYESNESLRTLWDIEL